MDNRVTVVAAIIVRNGRVLVAQRAEGDYLAGSWEFPGGKVEPGESWESALKREMKEELGVEIDLESAPPIAKSEWDYDHARVRLVGLRAQITGGEPTALDHAALRWVEPEALEALPLLPADRPIAREIARILAG